ncbi:MAG: glycosyltransferase [Ignavibacteria bacterium]
MIDPDKKSVAHIVTPYLFYTGSWVYNQIVGVKDFNSFVFTQRKENLDQFPLNNIISAEDFPPYKIFLNKIYVKYSGKYGLFFRRETKKNKINIFHAHMGFEACYWIDMVKHTSLPFVTSFYGQDVSKLGKIDSWLKKYKLVFDYGALFLAEGPFLRKQLIEIGCPEEKTVIQKLGIHVDKYPVKDWNKKNNKIKIMQVSAFREKKGIEYSLEAVSLLKKKFKDFEFVLAGGWDNEEAFLNIKNLIKKLSIEDKVSLLGKITHKQMIEKLLDCDIFLHPSVIASDGDNEGGAPVSIMEASAMGLPVVSTLHADIPEVIIHNKTGLLSEEKNSPAVCANLIELINSDEKRINFGLAGRKYIEEKYNLVNQVEKLSNIYHNLIGS